MDNINSFFKYKVFYWDDINDKEIIIKGITYADSFSNAVCNIERYYGKDSIVSLEVYSTDSYSACYEFEEDETNE